MSRKVLEHLGEAASVMLDRYHNKKGESTLFGLQGPIEDAELKVQWNCPSQETMASHANEKKATEDGAEGIAIASVRVVAGYIVRKRAHHGSGSDFIMTRENEPENDFVKLEVSGIAGKGSFEKRKNIKRKQASKGDLDRPWVTVIVGFERALISLEEGK